MFCTNIDLGASVTLPMCRKLHKLPMTNLSGLWEGQYKYPNSWQSPVSFDADISDGGGVLSGIISEPNTFDAEAGHLLTAAMAGRVSSDKVSFTKTYVGEGRAQHSVTYKGLLSDKGNRITGQWMAGFMKGRFEMNRLSGGEVLVKEEHKELELEDLK